MADTEIEPLNETDLSAKLNGTVDANKEQLDQSNESQKTNKIVDNVEQNHSSNLKSDKSCLESSKSLSNCSDDGKDDYTEINDEENHSSNKNHINSNDCKSDEDIEDNQTCDKKNDTLNNDGSCDAENSCNGTEEINRIDSEEQMEIDDVAEEQNAEDNEQMDYEDEMDDNDRLNDQNDTESRSNEIKKSLEDSSINLDKSVTIVKVTDPKQSSNSSGKKKVKGLPDITLTPRRSSRNLNKVKSFSEDEKKEVDDDIVSPMKTSTMVTKPIVVNDTKKLVEIAAGTKQKSNKKEPTLVIIDTNMLSGRSNLPLVSMQSNIQNNSINISQTTSKTVQNSYNRVHQSQTTIKPYILTPNPASVAAPQIIPKPPIILPTLTDDMFVVEAPSFIVPYVYEKPPKKPLKEFVEKFVDKIKDTKAVIVETPPEVNNTSLGNNHENNQHNENSSKQSENVKMDIDEPENVVSSSEKISEVEKESSRTKANGDEPILLDESDNTKKDNPIDKNVSESTDLKTSDNITDLTVDSDEKKTDIVKDKPKTQSTNYFENPLGKFFMQIGVNLVQEHVQLDLLRTQRRKRDREGDKCPEEVHMAINSLIKTLEFSKENNDPFQFGLKKCELCNFKSESSLVMAHHLETPHMTANYCYRCNFCTFQVRSPHEILQHMDTHSIRGRLERGPALHQCPSCPFEDSYKGKLTRHLISCTKKYRPEINQAPPLDWEPPAKIPRVLRNKPSMSPGNAVYQAAMSGFKQFPNSNMLQIQQQQYNKMVLASSVRGRGRAVIPGQRFPGMVPSFPNALPNQTSGGILLKNTSIKPINQSMIVPNPYSINNHTYQQNSNSNKSVQQPSISITPLPRSFPSSNPQSAFVSTMSKAKSQQQTQSSSSSTSSSNKPTFVICEICDGYIKDLEQLRNHMQWIHKVKIHPKMIYNRPPLNCQKCQFRFFTDQGLERHLLGSHGLVTSSMQEAANKGKDGGRCPVCGRVYQWKLLNHVSRDHSMSLKPAHLSYKCTVCTATFGMYKQFENHVYSAHSNVAKNSTKKPLPNQPVASSSSTSLTTTPKQLKINDEITIIPQPPKIHNLSMKSSKPVSSVGKQSSTPTTAKAKV